MIIRELTSVSPEFHEAFVVISRDIAPWFVESEEYIQERFRIQEGGTATDNDRRIISEGFRIRAIAAKDERTNTVVGAIFSNFIPKIGNENRGFALIGYISVHPEYRRQGVGIKLVEEMSTAINSDAIRITAKPAIGLLFEIEEKGKIPIEQLALKMGGYPLDIDYYQPSVRADYPEQQMNLWFLPFDQPVLSLEEAKKRTYPAEFIHDMVKSLFIYAYPGQDRPGFKETSKAYLALVASLIGKTSIGYKIEKL